MSSIFEIVGEETCGDVTCDLLTKGCGETLTSKYISLEKDVITVKRNKESGWGPENICVKC